MSANILPCSTPRSDQSRRVPYRTNLRKNVNSLENRADSMCDIYVVRMSRHGSQRLFQQHPRIRLVGALVFRRRVILAQFHQDVSHRRQYQLADLQHDQIGGSFRRRVRARHEIIPREHLQERVGFPGHHEFVLDIVRFIRERIQGGHQQRIQDF